ncbi:hypothetical protein JCM10213_002329 [Rhodosporidiobolus nylandii]
MSDTSDSHKTIIVLGATGQQGSGAVLHLLERTPFRVVGTSRTPSSPASLALLYKHRAAVEAGRFELIEADVGDVLSLKNAFEGAHGVFAVTQYSPPLVAEVDLRFEEVAGKNIVDAAKITGVTHLIYSGLPSIRKATNDRYKHIFRFEHKAVVEQYGLDVLGPGVFTIVHPAQFINNLGYPHYAKKIDGELVFRAPLSEGKVQRWVDATYDVGLFVSEIFLLGPTRTGGKTYPIHSEPISFKQMVPLYTSLTGIPARVSPSTLAEWTTTVVASQGPGIARDITEMIQWFDEAPFEEDKGAWADYGTMKREEYELRMNELGGKVRASTFVEWLGRSEFKPAE